MKKFPSISTFPNLDWIKFAAPLSTHSQPLMRTAAMAEACISAAGRAIGLYRPTEPDSNSCSNGLRSHSLMSLLRGSQKRQSIVWTLVYPAFHIFLPIASCQRAIVHLLPAKCCSSEQKLLVILLNLDSHHPSHPFKQQSIAPILTSIPFVQQFQVWLVLCVKKMNMADNRNKKEVWKWLPDGTPGNRRDHRLNLYTDLPWVVCAREYARYLSGKYT